MEQMSPISLTNWFQAVSLVFSSLLLDNLKPIEIFYLSHIEQVCIRFSSILFVVLHHLTEFHHIVCLQTLLVGGWPWSSRLLRIFDHWLKLRLQENSYKKQNYFEIIMDLFTVHSLTLPSGILHRSRFPTFFLRIQFQLWGFSIYLN